MREKTILRHRVFTPQILRESKCPRGMHRRTHCHCTVEPTLIDTIVLIDCNKITLTLSTSMLSITFSAGRRAPRILPKYCAHEKDDGRNGGRVARGAEERMSVSVQISEK